MPSYIQGSQTYIPQIQPFTPDYNFYQGALELKQSKYDAAKKQLSSLYGSLLYAPMTREDNVESRDKFFDVIQQDIQKMATMDLSLEQNVNAAMDVFNQITDNDNIAHDMVWTKQFQQQYQKGQYLKNCPDPEKCGGSWWEGGDRLMNYSREEYKRASKTDALKMSAPSYVSHQNVMEKAIKIGKDFDLNITQDEIKGGYIVTTKNGALAEPMAQQLLFGTLGNDPKIAEFYKAQAQLERKDFMYSNEAQYGSLESAEQAYIGQIEAGIAAAAEKNEAELNDKVETTEKKKKQVEAKQKEALPEEQNDLLAYINELDNGVSQYKSSQDLAKQTAGTARNAKAQGTMSGFQVDALVAASSLQRDLSSAATVLAYKDYEQSFTADPYSLENVKFQNRMQEKQLDYLMKRDLIKYKYGLEAGLDNLTVKGTAEHNVPDILEEGVAGGSAPTDEEGLATRGFDQLTDVFNNVKTDVSSSERLVFSQVMDRTTAEAERGNVQAQEDYVMMITNLLGASLEDDESFGLDAEARINQARIGDPAKAEQRRIGNQRLSQIQNATTLAEKYRLARQANLDVNKLEGSQVDLVYDAVMPSVTKMDGANKYTRDYLAPLFKNKNVLAARRNIEAKDAHLKSMGKGYSKMAKDVASKVRADADYTISMQDPTSDYEKTGGWGASEVEISNEVLGDAIEAYVDGQGNVVDSDTFINNMVAQGHSRSVADALYNGGRIDPSWYHYLGSWGDAAVTTVGGVLGEISNVFEWLLPNIGEEGKGAGAEWGEGFGDWGGWDYDTATAIANRNAAGDIDKAGYSDDQVGYGAMTIHDVFKRAVTKYGKPEGDMAWGGVTGMGNYAAKAQRYKVVDPAASTSVGAMGVKGVFTDFFNNSGSVVDMGGFTATKPDENNEEALAALQLIQNDFYRNPGGKDRPQMSVTYSDVAGSDANTIGVNIKVINPKYIKAYQGSKENPGVLRGEIGTKLSTEGITLYMDRDKATNIFKTASNKTSLEHLMSINGEIGMDEAAGGYSDNFKIKTMGNGTYKASGMVQVGLDENGMKQYDYFETIHPGTADVNDLVQSFDDILGDLREQNEALRMTWLKQQASKF
jgi:hypothetical protein